MNVYVEADLSPLQIARLWVLVPWLNHTPEELVSRCVELALPIFGDMACGPHNADRDNALIEGIRQSLSGVTVRGAGSEQREEERRLRKVRLTTGQWNRVLDLSSRAGREPDELVSRCVEAGLRLLEAHASSEVAEEHAKEFGLKHARGLLDQAKKSGLD